MKTLKNFQKELLFTLKKKKKNKKKKIIINKKKKNIHIQMVLK